ncbi:MAG: AMP-binding protein [Planctomycetia bacterium]|nr:AMP-binding protein [Planctomycetia bacterium]
MRDVDCEAARKKGFDENDVFSRRRLEREWNRWTMSLNLALDFQIASEKYREYPAIIYNGLNISYGELANSVRHWSILLSRMGVSRGDHVAMVMPNVPEFTIAYFAILHLGAVVVPCNTLLTYHELAYLLSHSDAKYVIAYHSCMVQSIQAARETDSCAGVIVTGTKEAGLKILPEAYHDDAIFWVEDEIAALRETYPVIDKTFSLIAEHDDYDWRGLPDKEFENAPWPTGGGGVSQPEPGESREVVTSTIPVGEQLPPSAGDEDTTWEALPTADGKARFSWSPAPVPTSPNSTAVILYTSGTTGFPKGAQLTHFNLYSNAMFVREFMTGYQPGRRTIAILPFYHSFGQTFVQNAALFSGAAIVMVPRFEPKRVLQSISEEQVGVMAGVPTMLIHLARQQQKQQLDLSSLYQIVSGGSSLPVEMYHELCAAFPSALVLEGYGLSETSPLATCTPPGYKVKPGSIGMEIPGSQTRIMRPDKTFAAPGEMGEIVVRGHNVMKGYHKNPLATQQSFVNSWFLTGDIGYCDDEGYFFLVDRKKDIIIRAGMNIYPREIEEILHAHPSVQHAAVVGMPHPIHGEDVVGVVTLKEGEDISALELGKYCRVRLAAYKCPQQIVILDEMPKGPTGKILKREIKKLLSEEDGNLRKGD